MAPRQPPESSPPSSRAKLGVKPPPKKGRGRPKSAVFQCFSRHVDTKGLFLENECHFCLFRSTDASENATYLKRHILSACGAAPEHVKQLLLGSTTGKIRTGAMGTGVRCGSAEVDDDDDIPSGAGNADQTPSLCQRPTLLQQLPQHDGLINQHLQSVNSQRTEPSSQHPNEQDVRIIVPLQKPAAQMAARRCAPRRGRKRSPAPLSFNRNVDGNGKFFANICKHCSYLSKSENVTILRNHLRSKKCTAPPEIRNQLRSPSK